MSIASQIERLQGVRKEINTKLQELKLTDTDKDFQGISDTLNTVVTNPVINDTLTVTKTSVTVPKGFYDTEGTVNIVTEEKTATTNGEVIPTEGKVLSKVIVNVPSTTVKLQEKTATPSKEQQVISPDEGYDGLSQVTINGDEDLIADNIKKDVNIFGVVGTYEGSGGGGSAELSSLIEGSITDLSIPEGVTKIKWYNFYNCYDLENIVLPKTLTEIGSYAFKGCISLKLSQLSNSINYIGNDCFSGCSEITLSELPNIDSIIGTFQSCTNITVKKIPSTVTEIDRNAFNNCKGLTKLYIPSTCTQIALSYAYVFGGCSNLTDIYTDATEKLSGWLNGYWNITDPLTSTQATVHYGVSEEEFDAIVGGA